MEKRGEFGEALKIIRVIPSQALMSCQRRCRDYPEREYWFDSYRTGKRLAPNDCWGDEIVHP